MITREQLSQLKNGDLIYKVGTYNYVRHITFVGDINYSSQIKRYAIYDRSDNKTYQESENSFHEYFLTEKDALKAALEKTRSDLVYETEKLQSRIQYFKEQLQAVSDE